MRRGTSLGLVLASCIAFAASAALPPAPHVTSVNAAGRPTFIEGRLARVDSPVDEEALSRAAREVAPLFRIDAQTIELQRVKHDDLGITHARFRQVKNGIEVVGGDFVVHVDRDGVVFAAGGAARDRALPAPIPRIDGAAAVRAALATRAGDAGEPRLTYVLSSRDQSLYLAWEVVVSGSDDEGFFQDAIYIDACSASVVDVRPRIVHFLQRRIYSIANDFYLPGTLLRFEGGAPSNDAIANADYDHWGRVYQCFAGLFNRNSYDDQGATIVSTIHFGWTKEAKDNASWNGTQFIFGEGDGVDFLNFALAYDVHAHEFMHAVTQYESSLGTSNEPGAVNESLSDAMAAICDQMYPPAAEFGPVNPWTIMETTATPGIAGDAHRYLSDPALDGKSSDYYPDRYRGIDDFGGIHWNSGIGNLAFYLLSVGGTHPRGKTTLLVPGIGILNAAKIFYKAEDYLFNGATFSDMRSATILASSSLNMPSDHANAVRQAWAAVGVGDPAPPPPPQPIVLPAAPTSLTANATAPGQIDLAWKDNSTAESGFKIERATGSGAFAEIDRVGQNVTAYANRSLAASTQYAYRVRAYNANGSSSYSNTASATTPAANAGVPIAPTGLRGTAVTNSSIELTWSHEGNDEDGFIIERGEKLASMAEVKRVGANILKNVDGSLTAETTYLYRVRAYNKAGASTPSNLIEVRTLGDLRGCCSSHNGVCGCSGDRTLCCDNTLSPTCPCEWLQPNAPVDLTARSSSGNSILLTWRDTSSNETSFVIERSKNGPFLGIGSVGANIGSFTDVNAARLIAAAPAPAPAPRYDQPTGTMISYRVFACKSSLCSAPSNVVSLATDCRGTMLPTRIADFGPPGGYGVFTISVFGGCTWGATVYNPDWIRLRNRNGNGTGIVEYDVLPNPGPPRTGYISVLTGHPMLVGFLIHEVWQAGTAPPPPSALAAASVANNAVALSWASSGAGASYAVERRDVCETAYAPIASVGNTSYVDAARTTGVEYLYRVRALRNGAESEYSNIAPAQGAGASCTGGSLAALALAPQGSAASTSPLLTAIVPTQLASTTRRANPPRGVIGATNAVEAIGFDYMSNATGLNVAAIAAFRTKDTAFENDYGAWTRFQGGRLTRIAPVALRPKQEDVWFWSARVEHDDRPAEWGITFAVFVGNANKFTVDSQWISEAYSTTHTGDVLTFDVWSDSETTTKNLALQILQNLAANGTVTYDNRREPPGTLIVATHATYAEPNVILDITNASETSRTLTFAITAWPAAAPAPERRQVFSETVLPGQNTIELPMPDILGAFITIDDGIDFIDKVFVADGRWLTLGSAAGVTYDASGCTAADTLMAIDRHVSGCAHMRGSVAAGAEAGFARMLEVPGRRDVDVSRWPAVTFFARGDQKNYRMMLETDAARVAGAPPYAITFTAPAEGRQFVVPLRAFAQPPGTPEAQRVPLTGAGVHALSWSNADASGSIDLAVDHVAFTGSVAIRDTTHFSDPASPGSYRVTTRVTDDVEVLAVTLAYRIGSAGAFTRVPMTAAGNAAQFAAGIPSVPRGAEVSYYIEATDDSGNVATDPFNAPSATYDFHVRDARTRAVRR